MTPERLKRHRAVLAAHKAALDEASRNQFSIPAEQFEVIRDDIEALHTDCPGLVPPLDARQLMERRERRHRACALLTRAGGRDLGHAGAVARDPRA